MSAMTLQLLHICTTHWAVATTKPLTQSANVGIASLHCMLLFLLQENTPDAERTLMIRENIYVRVHGHVRAFAGKRSVVAFRVTPITDMNELTTHMLEVIYAHAYLVRGGTSMVMLLHRSCKWRICFHCQIVIVASPRGDASVGGKCPMHVEA